MATHPPNSSHAGLPSLEPTNSYWLQNLSEKLAGHHTSEDLPSVAETVVIGSGITGAFAARELVKSAKSVLMLEAREACSGATGRNGGHCQPAIWDAPPHIARFELSNFNLIKRLIEDNAIPCEWQVVGGLHAIFSPLVQAAARHQIQNLDDHTDLQGKAVLIEDKEVLKSKRIPNAVAAVYQPNAAKLSPYKLVAWILEDLLERFDATKFSLQTNTPVLSIERSAEISTWNVHTSRGVVSAKQVLLATNAYTPHLLQTLGQVIVPVRAQIAALEPPQDTLKLEHTYVWMKGADHQYVIQGVEGDVPSDRGLTDGHGAQEESSAGLLIFGGERFSGHNGEEGIFDDDVINPLVSAALRRNVLRALRVTEEDHYSSSSSMSSLKAVSEWTGIMGYSRDGGPWVGPVPQALLDPTEATTGHSETNDTSASTGLFVSGGYTGHGMPVAALCGIKVAEMMMLEGRGSDRSMDSHAALPEEWLVSQDRLEKVKDMQFPTTEEEMTALLTGMNS